MSNVGSKALLVRYRLFVQFLPKTNHKKIACDERMNHIYVGSKVGTTWHSLKLLWYDTDCSLYLTFSDRDVMVDFESSLQR